MNQSCRDSEASGGRPAGLCRPDSPGKTDSLVTERLEKIEKKKTDEKSKTVFHKEIQIRKK